LTDKNVFALTDKNVFALTDKTMIQHQKRTLKASAWYFYISFMLGINNPFLKK